MKLIDKIYNISWDGESSFEICSMDKTINAKVIFYSPNDSRNKATGKGSRSYKHGLMVACSLYRDVKVLEMNSNN